MSEIREWSEKARRCSWNIDEDGGDKRAEGGGSEDVENVDRDEAGGVGTMTDCDGWVLRDETGAECEGASGFGDAELGVSTTGSSAGAET